MNMKRLSIVRFYFAQSVMMCNIHFKAHDRVNKQINEINFMTYFCSALSLIAILFQLLHLGIKSNLFLNIGSVVGLFATFFSLLLGLIYRSDLHSIAHQHRIIAEKYKILRDELMVLLEEIMSEMLSNQEFKEKTSLLFNRYDLIGEIALTTTSKDYQKAQKSLMCNCSDSEEFSWSDDEIDRFLPKQLRSIEYNNLK